jgi:hypothetical protein
MTSSKSRIKGTHFETECVNFLKSVGCTKAHRNTNQTGANPTRVDILGVEGWSIECKDDPSMSDGVAMDETVRKAFAGIPVLIRKRRGKGVGQAFVIMELRTFAPYMLAFAQKESEAGQEIAQKSAPRVTRGTRWSTPERYG